MTFRVGQKVVCIKLPVQPYDLHGFIPSVVGRIYTIREIYISPVTHTAALRFQENINPICWLGIESGYDPTRFRPIVERKTDISVFHEILLRETRKTGADA